ncbi:CBS domain-containing protein [Candidatus Woesearchaeota archaeon]|nr:CBS domain-containing protein [Candidatus Woesearchaeota archaeon]
MVEDDLIKKKYLRIDKSASVSKLIGQLKLHKEKAALVFDKNKFLGVADTHLLVKTKLNPAQMKVKKIVKRVHVLNGKESLKETVRLMFAADTRMLPVKEKGQIIGVVKSKDIISKLKETEHAKKKITEVMTPNFIAIYEHERIGKAIYLMKENNISRLPIVDKEGVLVNIISLTDLLNNFILNQQSKSESRGRGSPTMKGTRTIRAFRQRIDLNAFPVKNISTTIMITASPEDTLERVIDKMERFDISSIVVVDGKFPEGIVTTRDLLKLFLKDMVTY